MRNLSYRQSIWISHNKAHQQVTNQMRGLLRLKVEKGILQLITARYINSHNREMKFKFC